MRFTSNDFNKKVRKTWSRSPVQNIRKSKRAYNRTKLKDALRREESR